MKAVARTRVAATRAAARRPSDSQRNEFSEAPPKRAPLLFVGTIMTMNIRRAERRDLKSVGELGAMLMETHYAFDPQRFLAAGAGAARGYASFLASVIESPEACVFVAEEEGGRVVGYVYAALEPLSWKELRGPAGFIHDVAVREEARRSGVATQLLDAATAWLREHGAPRVILWTAAPNAAAQHLFRRIGFRDTMLEMTMELEG
jgi:ribosomal protein S18 acetylase RimI-like enzyme